MDALFAVSPGGFFSVTTHISLYHEDMSPGFDALATQCLKDTGLKPAKFTRWNVKGMKEIMAKAMPVEVHGNHVLIDEEAIRRDPAAVHGVVRYSLRSAAHRRYEGGRWLYDFVVMNFTLFTGFIFSTAFLYHGRNRYAKMRARPFLSIAASYLVFAVSVPLVKGLFKLFSVGMLLAEKSHKKCLNELRCRECLCDVLEATKTQIAELKETGTLKRPPGVPEPPPDVVATIKKQSAAHAVLLERELDVMAVAIHKAQALHCDVHAGLLTDPEGYQHPEGFPIFDKDRTLGAQRRAERLAAEAAGTTVASA